MNPPTENVLLNYRVRTEDGVLRTGTPDHASRTQITITVSAQHDTWCSSIRVKIPLGNDADDLTAQRPDVSVSSLNWSFPSSDSLNTHKAKFATFILQPRDTDDYRFKEPFDIIISANVNAETGTTAIEIEEVSGTDPDTLIARTKQLRLEKEEPVFFLRNFISTTLASPQLPCSEFANKEDIRFAWESNGTSFALYCRNKKEPVWSGETTFCVVKGGISSPATFILVALYTAEENEAPERLYDSISISVRNADLKAASLVVEGNRDEQGKITAGTVNAGFVKSTDAEITGLTMLNSVLVSGSINSATVLLANELTAAKITTNKLYAAKAELTEANIDVIRESISLFGPVQRILSGTGNLSPQTYVSKTDGLVIGSISNSQFENLVAGAIAYGSTEGLTVSATGGHHAIGWYGTLQMWANSNTFVLPVRRGIHWSISVFNSPLNSRETMPPYTFDWLPLGNGHFEGVKSTARSMAMANPYDKLLDQHAKAEEELNNLSGLFSEVLGDKLTEEQSSRLNGSLRKLFLLPETKSQ